MPAGSAVPAPGTSTRNKRLLLLLAAIALAPVVLSYLAYYAWPRDARVNYGELLTGSAPPVVGQRQDGSPFALTDLRGRWIILHAASGECAGGCADALYASRQARTIQNAERERVARVWLVSGDVAPVRVAAPPALPRGVERIYLIDPLGNFVLAWPSKPDIKAMAKDLGRLLRASSIG